MKYINVNYVLLDGKQLNNVGIVTVSKFFVVIGSHSYPKNSIESLILVFADGNSKQLF